MKKLCEVENFWKSSFINESRAWRHFMQFRKNATKYVELISDVPLILHLSKLDKKWRNGKWKARNKLYKKPCNSKPKQISTNQYINFKITLTDREHPCQISAFYLFQFSWKSSFFVATRAPDLFFELNHTQFKFLPSLKSSYYLHFGLSHLNQPTMTIFWPENA